MKKKYILIGVCLSVSIASFSQGCLPIRNIAGFGQFAQLGYATGEDKWMLNISVRYFDAFQSYIGTTKRPLPPTPDRFVNYNRTLNFSLDRMLKNGWSISLNMPIYYNASSGKAEHLSGEKHTTYATGVGDIRFMVDRWLMNPEKSVKGNLQLGLGLKLPTGDYRSQDYFYNDPVNPSARTLAPVDPSIQLGDGGTGFLTELNGYYIFNPAISVNLNLFYLINPKDHNGVSNIHGVPPANWLDQVYIQSGMDVNSVPDNYTCRAGVNFTIKSLVIVAGFRYEGAPARDLIGGNDGLRRVGHIFSFEPGLQIKLNKGFFYTFYTLPLDRRTIQTIPDKAYSSLSGTSYITPGRFANFLLFVGYAFTFGAADAGKPAPAFKF